MADNDANKTKAQLIDELIEMRQRLARLEAQAAEREQAQEVLRVSQAHFASILEIANQAIISIDETQQITLFNRGAEEIFGYSADEVIGQSLDILLADGFVIPHRNHIAEFAASSTTARLMGERQEISGRRKSGEEFPAAASISKLEAGGERVFTVVLRDITQRKHLEQDQQNLIIELNRLNAATRTIVAELSLEQVLKKIAEVARTLVKVKYAALGLHDGHGYLSRFITAGIAPADHAKIGPLPMGRGLLGPLFYQGKSLIIKDIADHASAVGFPEHHPQMKNLLGVPIFSKGELIGAIYLADKQDGLDFTDTDRQLVEMLALNAAIALENARLYEQTQRLAILEERERFSRDLHDGIIQSIYGVGLVLDQAKLEISPANQAAGEQIELSLKSLAGVIQDIRNYIFDLRPHAHHSPGLKARLDGLIAELQAHASPIIQAEIGPNIDTCLSEIQAKHLFHICREALSNAVRHANAGQITLSLLLEKENLVLRIEDNGIGFELKPQTNPGHHGLGNMRVRASEIDAILKIDSTPQEGTRLILTLACWASSKPT